MTSLSRAELDRLEGKLVEAWGRRDFLSFGAWELKQRNWLVESKPVFAELIFAVTTTDVWNRSWPIRLGGEPCLRGLWLGVTLGIFVGCSLKT